MGTHIYFSLALLLLITLVRKRIVLFVFVVKIFEIKIVWESKERREVLLKYKFSKSSIYTAFV